MDAMMRLQKETSLVAVEAATVAMEPITPLPHLGALPKPSGELCHVYISHYGEDIFAAYVLENLNERFPLLKVSKGEPAMHHQQEALGDAFVGACMIDFRLSSIEHDGWNALFTVASTYSDILLFGTLP
jgi:hypothetical protein